MTYSSFQTQNHSSAFKLYLEAKNYQPATVKNYIADTNIYLRSAASQNPFSPTIISAYITSLSSKNNAKRYLASLKKFCQFAADQHLCPSGIFKTSLRSAKSNPLYVADPASSGADRLSNGALLSQFEQHLTRKNRSPSTIKNYLNDLQQYIEFCQKHQFYSSEGESLLRGDPWAARPGRCDDLIPRRSKPGNHKFQITITKQ